MTDGAMDAFVAYALAFEESFATDDWSAVDALMHDDIVWAVAGAPEPIGEAATGRAAAIGAIERSVAEFDRRFDVRTPKAVTGPTEIPGGIYMEWQVTFAREGLPPFELRGEEWDLFTDGKLAFHIERIHNLREVFDYLELHDSALQPGRR